MEQKEVKLDLFELGYLLEACMKGSHLRSGTIRRFVDEWYDLLTPEERIELFEWTIRLTHNRSWERAKDPHYKPHFEADSRLCGEDRIFVHRYHPENQYLVTAEFEGKEKQFETFLMDGEYYTGSHTFISPEYIKSVEKIDIPQWQKFKHPDVDYDWNILS